MANREQIIAGLLVNGTVQATAQQLGTSRDTIYKAMQEDGLYNFRFELLEECPRENLNEKEKYYIDLYESIVYGYNSQGGING